MLKNFVLFLVCSFLLILPITGFSLGLGKITVYSKLNEALHIQIELVNSKTTLLDDIIVKNANSTTYKRANLPRPESFRNVRFKSKKAADGSIYIELTSKRPVREPFITFIADLKWRKGHINREYTFLLDPPEFIQQQSKQQSQQRSRTKTLKTKTVQTSTVAKTAQAGNSRRQTQQRKMNYSTLAASPVGANTYATRHADTLWEIARKLKPGHKVSTYQTMHALFALNPDAFINNNINLLKQGQILKIPSVDEVLKIAESSRNNSSRKKTSSSSKKQSSAQSIRKQTPGLRTKSTQKKAASTQDKVIPTKSKAGINEGKLKIIPPTKAILNAPVTSAEDLLLINRTLQKSISTIKSLKNENATLSQQINELTAKLNNLDHHNQNLNSKISAITAQLSQKKNDQTTSSINLPEQQAIPEPVTVANKTLKTELKTTKNNTTEPQPAKSPEAVSQEQRIEIDSELAKATKQRSFIRELVTSPVIAFALAIFTIIVLFAVLYILRHQKERIKLRKLNSDIPYPSKNSTKKPTLTSLDPTQKIHGESLNEALTSLQGTDISEEKDEEDMDFFEYFEKKINAPEPDISSERKTADIENTRSEEAAEISFNLDISNDEIEDYEENILKPKVSNTTYSEIDTYLAYGNYAEAEQCLHELLENNTADKNLHLKLFECYTYANKRYEFIQHVEKNTSLLDSDLVLRHRVENLFQQTWNESLATNQPN